MPTAGASRCGDCDVLESCHAIFRARDSFRFAGLPNSVESALPPKGAIDAGDAWGGRFGVRIRQSRRGPVDDLPDLVGRGRLPEPMLTKIGLDLDGVDPTCRRGRCRSLPTDRRDRLKFHDGLASDARMLWLA